MRESLRQEDSSHQKSKTTACVPDGWYGQADQPCEQPIPPEQPFTAYRQRRWREERERTTLPSTVGSTSAHIEAEMRGGWRERRGWDREGGVGEAVKDGGRDEKRSGMWG